jgi:methionyl-tRNA formyltransferase
MRIVYMGTPGAAAFTLEQLLGGSDPVVGVVTQPDRPVGRGQREVASPVRRVADSRGIPVVTPQKLRDPNFLDILRSWRPELIVVVAYGRILPRSILELPPHGCLNVHYSILPKYRGAAPIAWAILQGDASSGVTTMELEEQMDAGPIFLQKEVPIEPQDTQASLQDKMAPIGAVLLRETIRRLTDGTLVPQRQRDDEATYAPMLKKEDGRIDWKEPAQSIERRVRAFYPWPSAYTYWNGKLLKIHRAAVVSTNQRVSPGEVIRADSGGLWIATGEAGLGLEEVQMENKKRLPAAEFLKGARIVQGEHLDSGSR